MAKNKVFDRHFLYIILVVVAAFIHSCIELPNREEIIKQNLRSNFIPVKQVKPVELSQREKVVKAYTKKIGWCEKTGRNDGKEIEYILGNVGLKKGDAWCAAFVYTCYYESGVTSVPRSGYSPNWFPKANTYYVKGVRGKPTAEQADVFGIYIPSKKRIGHVGFIDSWPDGETKCITVEGNTSLVTDGSKNDHDGQGVERKRRLKSQINKLSRWI